MTKPSYEEPPCMDASYRIGYADGLKKNEAELARVRGLLQRQLDEKRLRQILELERIKVAQGVKAILDVIKGRQWLSEEGRGPYSYDDARYQKEFGYALNEISAALKPLEAIAGDLTDCPTKWEEIQECWKLATPNFPQSSSLVSQGAESADIGKLDAVDEQMPRCLACGIIGKHLCAYSSGVEMGKVNSAENKASNLRKSGSAETGGEKAACVCGCAHKPECDACKQGEHISKEDITCDHPHLDGIDQATGPDKIWECQSCKGLFREVKDGIYTKWIATFPRSSQNQTVSSGVGRTHEGTTADKSGA